MATAVDLSGSWKLDCTEENFDAFLKVCGVSWAWRKAATSVRPAVTISQTADGGFVIVTRTRYQTQEMHFTVGQEFRSIVPWEGRERPMQARWEEGGRRLVILVTGTDISFAREIQDGRLVLTQSKGELSSRRFFRRSAVES